MTEPAAGAMPGGEGDVLDTAAAGPLVIRGGIVRALGHAGSTLLALLGIAVVTRHLGVDDFGRFQTVTALITVVGTVSDAGMAALGLREYAQRRGGEREQLMGTLMGLRVALTLVGTALACGIAAALGYGSDLVTGTLIAGLGLALITVQTTLLIPMVSELRNVPVAVVDVLRQGLTTTAYVALAASGAAVIAFLAAPLPVGLVLVVVIVVLVRGRVPRPSLDVRAWGRLLRVAAAFSLATAVGTVYVYASQVLVAAVATEYQTGLYAASFRTFVVVGSVAGLVTMVAFPLLSRAARDDRERLAYAVQRLLDTSVLLGVAAGLTMVLGAAPILAVIAGPGFSDATPAMQIQGIAVVATYVLAPLSFVLLSLHLHRPLLIANAVAVTVMFSVVGWLAGAHGATGAAVGTVIGELTLAVGYVVALRRKAPDVCPGPGRSLRAVAAALPPLALLATGLPAVVSTAAGLLFYGVAVVVLGVIPQELRELVPQRRRPRGPR